MAVTLTSLAAARDGSGARGIGGGQITRVCPDGPPACDTASIQVAVDQAAAGDEIRIAGGIYSQLTDRAGMTQVVYVSKTLALRGGFTISDWDDPDPVANPTRLDAQGGGRVLYVSGEIDVRIEGLELTGGDAAGMGGCGPVNAGGGVTLRALRDGGLAPIVVVLEPTSPCLELHGLRQPWIQIAINPDPDRGMLSSIRAGLAALPHPVDAVAVQPGDQPFVPAAAVARLIAHFGDRRPLLLAPRYLGRRGHPLLIARALFAEAAACDDAIGLRQLLRRRAADLVELDFDDPHHFSGADDDLDRPEDCQRLLGGSARRK